MAMGGENAVRSITLENSSHALSDGRTVHYRVERQIGCGSFGAVFQVVIEDTGEVVAIKKIFQDKRIKNRELQIMRQLHHGNIVQLKHSFYSRAGADDLYLNLVLEYIPETIYSIIRRFQERQKVLPLIYTKLYMYQMCIALGYLHSMGICHRDIKPHNVLVNPQTHVVKLCDFGSAKMLQAHEPNVSYICSRMYRAPELIFGATNYTTAIDMWSLGCVFGEMLLSKPLFPGESGFVDQLSNIIKIVGTPTRDDVHAMNPQHTDFKFPRIRPQWAVKFGDCHSEAVDLITKMLVYAPSKRMHPLEAAAHPFFDDLRRPHFALANNQPVPPLFNFTLQELSQVPQDVRERLVPPHARNAWNWTQVDES
ncbi:CMGC/GSK protein kinase [Saprolegnia parasitica CBS 223.65]|uniref:CMGC/GSK protein kinase n=1 Tax=Saprolegnia parasitica (strain CBS 223.65) TaxID=695850 RepID=A0A067CVD5_SAPPC|nr:CMGC/GSK protein kinase [Saprolegnia parasitica CBS 223.65]KDO30742.1 CMGC/GSK protein kinase [Saprolegnia parasitica CBS 223.65]|eukprot:XP_012198442.1 CMGC/GSK protein kinase [Saprolegnia parasitica CBS 223.65]